ncbi:Ig-like domain-containing protein [Chitinophaga qingshengii]|uniref:Gliding motility-associated C-terminal domain-containing protein n=1 Tax=Chitinophaga qingshengii TaxID=1569794 RepID=A0ABR7TRC0_9BACT|nr:Ig-like domain-containing protein [Chitinophaga qingshengii]MBC9933037.1 gliding motility-associated C-terminal domain-containing protein [Chitinophaga qingshengii]
MKKSYTWNIRLFLLTCVVMLCSVQALAQYTLTQLEAGGVYTAVAKDNADNVYATRYNPTTKLYDVVKFQGGAGTGSVVYAGLTHGTNGQFDAPWGIAVNSGGVIFILNSFESENGQIIRLRPPYNSPEVVQKGRYFTAITVDNTDNIYTLEWDGGSRYQVMQYKKDIEHLSGYLISSGVPLPGGGASYPWGIAITSTKDIYITDFLENNGGGVFKLSWPVYNATPLLTGKNVTALAVDKADNLYTTELATPTTSRIVKYTDPTKAGTEVDASLTASAPSYALGLAVVNNGTVFAGDGAAPGNGRLLKLLAPTTVASITRMNPDPTNAGTVHFKVVYADNVTGVTTNAFTVKSTGNLSPAPAVTGVSGSGTTYDVAVNTGTGNGAGSVQLEAGSTGITPAIGNVPYTGETYNIDRMPPAVSFTSVPLLITNGQTANFRFTANKPNVVYQGKLDNGASNNVTSPVSLTGLTEGTHTYSVSGTDAVGNISANAVHTWTIDLTPPAVQSVSLPAPGTYHIGQALDFTVNMSEIVYPNVNLTPDATSSPYLEITIGSVTRKAYYHAGAATNAWTFRYTITDGDNDADGIQAGNTLYTNGIILTDAVANSIAPTLNNIAGNIVKVTSKRPVVTFGTPVIINATTVRMPVSFDEPVTGLSATGISALGAPNGITVTNFTPNKTTVTDNYTFDMWFQPNNKGTISVRLYPNVVTSVTTQNTNLMADAPNFTFDNTVPVVTSVNLPADSYYKAGQTLIFTVNFSKPLTVNAGPSLLYLPVTIGSTTVRALYQSGSGSSALTFAYTVQAGDNDADGIALNQPLVDAGGRLSDGYGNATNPALNGVGSSAGIKVNTIIPNVTISTAAVSPVNGTFTADITFTDPVTGLLASAFTATNASVDNLSTSDNIHYTIDVTPATDGPVKLSLPAGAVQNIGGNDNNASNELQLTADFTSPTVVAVTGPGDGYYNETKKLTFTVVFSEVVQVNTAGGTPYMAINLSSGVVPAAYMSGSGTNTLTFGYPIQPQDDAPNGITLGGGISLGGGGLIADQAGNNAVLVLSNVPDFKNVIVNTTHPTVILTSAAPALVNGAFDVTITFSEKVTGLSTAGIAVTNGTMTNLRTTGGIIYTLTITPIADGNITIAIPADKATNIADNGNIASNVLQRTADITAPVLQNLKVPANGWYKTGDQLFFELTYNKTVQINTGTPSIALQIGQANVQATYAAGNGTNKLIFRYIVKNGDQDMDGIAYTNILTGDITDIAGNAVPAAIPAISTSNVLVNTIAPVTTKVTLPTDGYYNATHTLTFTVDFNEPVTVTGTPSLPVIIGTNIASARYTGGSGTNTLSFKYAVQNGDLDMDGIDIGPLLSLNGGSIKDPAGLDAVLTLNGIQNSHLVKVNTTHTTVILSTTTTQVNAPFTVNAVFGEAVTGLTTGDINVTNGQVSNLQTSDNITYTFAVTPVTDGSISIFIPADAAVNIGANGNQLSNTLSVIADATAPVLQNLKVPANGWYKTGDQLDFELTYNEAVQINSGIPSIGLQIGQANAEATYTAGTGTNKLTFRYTVKDGDQDMNGIAYTNRVTGNITDLAGNAAPAAIPVIATNNVLVNTIPPVTTKVTLPADGYYNATKTLTFAVTFNEPVTVTGTPSLPVIIGTGTVGATYTGGSGTTALSFSYTVQNGDTDMDGIDLGAALLLNGGTVKDPAGLDAVLTLNGIQNTHKVNINTTHPAATLTTTATRVNAPFTVKAVFSEAVTGMGLSGIRVTNGTASALQTIDNITYTFTVAPATDGNVSVFVAADAANNIGSNGNQVSNTLSITADMTAPVVAAGQQFNINQYSAAGTEIGHIAATDASGILQNWSIVSDLSGAFSIDPITGKLSVKDATLLNKQVNTTVKISVTVSDGLNTGTAQEVKISVIYVPLAPTAIAIDRAAVSENLPAGSVVGKFTTTTPEPGATFTYTLVSGSGDDDNNSFGIVGDQLQTNAVLVYATKHTYSVRIRTTQNNGLFTEKAFVVQVLQVNQAPTLDIVPDQAMCNITDKQTYQLTGASPVEAGQTLRYAVQSDKDFFSTLSVDAAGLLSYSLKSNVSGIAHITVTVKDNGGTANGGVDTLRRTFTLTVNALPQISITPDKTGDISKGDIITLTATGGNSYSWSPATGILDGQQTATLRIRALQPATYEVTATNTYGCTNTQQIHINVVSDFKVDATNILTPNGDGKNDRWVIRNLDSYPNNEVTIYDRTGRVIFHRRNYSNDWDGTLNGHPLAEGTYYYLLKMDGTDKVAKGFITIIRD